MMFHKEDVRFPAEGDIELSAWLFVPEHRATPPPAITMAHGYAGTKYHGIEPMAEALAEAGFVVLLHDHRGFGDSGGEPRHLVIVKGGHFDPYAAQFTVASRAAVEWFKTHL